MKRKKLSYFALILMQLLSWPSNSQQENHLVIGSWPDYIAPELISSFEDKFNTNVEFIYFNSEDDRNEQIIKYGTSRFDLIILSDFNIPLYQRLEWIEPLSKFDIPNTEHISSEWTQKYPNLSTYGVPYFWGVTGIAYRQDKVDTPPTSWEALLKPRAEHTNAIRLIDDSTDLISLCFHYLNVYTPNPTMSELERARTLLKNQKPYIRSYEYLDFNDDSTLIDGTDHLAFAYNGDAATLNKIKDEIKFVVPREGANIWMDFWAIMKNTKRPKLSEAFLNYINDPQNAAINAEFVNYPTPNTAAMALTSEPYKTNEMIFLSKDELARATPYIRFTPRATKEINSIVADIFD